jgi:hypothetical protein
MKTMCKNGVVSVTDMAQQRLIAPDPATGGGNNEVSMKSFFMRKLFKAGFVIRCVALMLFSAGVTHAEMISWYVFSDDITGLTADVVGAPNNWTTAAQAWNTSDEVIPAVGDQAACKVADVPPLNEATRRVSILRV